MKTFDSVFLLVNSLFNATYMESDPMSWRHFALQMNTEKYFTKFTFLQETFTYMD